MFEHLCLGWTYILECDHGSTEALWTRHASMRGREVDRRPVIDDEKP